MDEGTKIVLFTALNITLQTLLPVLVAAVASYVAVQVRAAWERIKQSQDDSVIGHIEWAVSVAINAAEQAGIAGLIKDKKEYALHVAQTILGNKGIKIDVISLEAAIEAAVYKELNKYPKLGYGMPAMTDPTPK